MKILCIVFAISLFASASFAQSQYQYSPDKLTQEQEHMLEQVKQEKALEERSKNLQQYRLQAKNPAQYNKDKPKYYNKTRKAYR